MEVFQRTAEARSFTAAAERLGMSKSMVSQRIAELEARLGVRLINRTTRRLSLTEAGQAFLERSRRVIEEVLEAEEAASRHGAALSGTLRIAAPLSFALLHLRPAILDFMAAHPGLAVQLDMDDRVVDLVQGGYDLAIRIGRLADSSLVARRVAPSRTLCCAAPAYLEARGQPDHPSALAGHEALLYAGSSRGDQWTFLIEGEWTPVPVRGRLQANSGDMLLSAALAGFGVALLPTFIVGPHVERGELVPILSDYPTREGAIHAVWPQSRLVPARVRAFTDFLCARVGPEPYWDRRLAALSQPQRSYSHP
jgi:DNA-binding transcriptional LysR family regulator